MRLKAAIAPAGVAKHYAKQLELSSVIGGNSRVAIPSNKATQVSIFTKASISKILARKTKQNGEEWAKRIFECRVEGLTIRGSSKNKREACVICQRYCVAK